MPINDEQEERIREEEAKIKMNMVFTSSSPPFFLVSRFSISNMYFVVSSSSSSS
jgi:hypothetical protein